MKTKLAIFFATLLTANSLWAASFACTARAVGDAGTLLTFVVYGCYNDQGVMELEPCSPGEQAAVFISRSAPVASGTTNKTMEIPAGDVLFNVFQGKVRVEGSELEDMPGAGSLFLNDQPDGERLMTMNFGDWFLLKYSTNFTCNYF